MLYLIATPIGNLQDISFRAVETLKQVDLILCEDTRKSGILLKKYGIATPAKSFHKFSEKKFEDGVIQQLKGGKHIALISDAGTPGINDPGQQLVDRCRQEGLQVTSLPGPSSPILALSLSGLSFDRFQFIGFLPKKDNERKLALIDAFFYPGVTVCFESPHRILQTLQDIDRLGPKQELALVREMTKVHEECLRGKAKDLLQKEILGEIVLVIEGNLALSSKIRAKEHVEMLEKEYGLQRQEAIKLAATLRGESKKELYRCFFSEEDL